MSCFECGGKSEVSHHVVPESRGGTRTVSLCGRCHGLAHHENRNMATSVLTKQALQKKKALGYRTGAVPFGFELSDGNRLLPIASEQKVLALVFNMRDSGASMRRIADFLTDWGIPTKRGGGSWSSSTIQGLLGRRDPVQREVA